MSATPATATATPVPKPTDRRSVALRLNRWAGNLGVVACFALACLMFGPSLLGYQRYVITGRSMTGTISKGSIVYDKEVPVSQLRVGDIITYKPPAGAGPTGFVTHRIHWVGRDRNGARAFRTKGDFNATPDPWRFTLTRPTQAREAFHVPALGYVLAALSFREVRMAVIGLPAILVAFAVLAGLWKEAGATTEDAEAGGPEPEGAEPEPPA